MPDKREDRGRDDRDTRRDEGRDKRDRKPEPTQLPAEPTKPEQHPLGGPPGQTGVHPDKPGKPEVDPTDPNAPHPDQTLPGDLPPDTSQPVKARGESPPPE